MKNVIILNGPPVTGKDTVADLIEHKLGATHLRFKTKLYADTAEYFDVDLDDLIFLASDRVLKETPSIKTNGKLLSPREALIHVSEEVIKPMHGHDHYGEYAAELLEDGLTVFSDGGFGEEVAIICQNADSVLVVRLSRSGCTFKGDSRKYISDELLDYYPNLTTIDYTVVEDSPELLLDVIGPWVLTK